MSDEGPPAQAQAGRVEGGACLVPWPVSAGPNDQQDIGALCDAARRAFNDARLQPPEFRAALLDALALALDARREEVLALAAEESALTLDELTPEFARMGGTLRLFAALVRDGSWVRAAVDTPRAHAGEAIGPNHDVRSLLEPLGPVAVFGASNFPLAYGVLGGDTASALAAGCPVVVKEHPAHPRLGRLLFGVADEVTKRLGHHGFIQYVFNTLPADFVPAQVLVHNASICAVGFTGSLRAGRTLQAWAGGRHEPIPVFAEMGSCNVVLVLRDAARTRLDESVDTVVRALLPRHGQQCTAPTVVLVAGHQETLAFYGALARRVAQAPVRRMLAPSVARGFYRRLDAILACGIVEEHTRLPTREERAACVSPPVALRAASVRMQDEPTAWEEVFGPAVIVASCGDVARGFVLAPGSLVVSILGEDDVEPTTPPTREEFDEFTGSPAGQARTDPALPGSRADIVNRLRRTSGRLVFNGPPTGVRVCDAMVHGGPWPATNRPDTTAVGPRAIERWCRPVCFQDCPDKLLPPELQDANPRGLWRTVNGERTKGVVRRHA